MKHTWIALGIGLLIGYKFSSNLKTLPLFSTINDKLNASNNT